MSIELTVCIVCIIALLLFILWFMIRLLDGVTQLEFIIRSRHKEESKPNNMNKLLMENLIQEREFLDKILLNKINDEAILMMEKKGETMRGKMKNQEEYVKERNQNFRCRICGREMTFEELNKKMELCCYCYCEGLDNVRDIIKDKNFADPYSDGESEKMELLNKINMLEDDFHKTCGRDK